MSAGVEREAALDAATGAPRRLLGLQPGLAHGSAADLVVLDEDLHPRFTLVRGAPAHVDPVAGRILGPDTLNHLRVEG